MPGNRPGTGACHYFPRRRSRPSGFSPLFRQCRQRLRVGLPQIQGKGKFRHLHRVSGLPVSRRQDADTLRPHACHRRLDGAELPRASHQRHTCESSCGIGYSLTPCCGLHGIRNATGLRTLGGRNRRRNQLPQLYRTRPLPGRPWLFSASAV